MVLSIVPALLGAAITVILALVAILARALTPPAGAAAAVFGVVIVVTVGFPFLALVALFVAGGVMATRYRIEEKRKRHVQEGVAGERGVSNVVSHILIPAGLAVVSAVPGNLLSGPSVALLFASALSFGAADTFASEFGVLAGRARSILTFQPVTPGTNGGISGTGQAFAFLGAASTAVLGLGFFLLFRTPVGSPALFLLVVTGSGFLGCQMDSVLGASLENRGLLTKGSTNFLAMLFAVLLAVLLLVAAGGSL
ncbi:MAG TPA: DUF92 domain-containing protein [Thermoplasmata archaeon]|nr:DUF92 domain-containing protein [Thermoplasmata archaeon]